jgi:hypothetical protein
MTYNTEAEAINAAKEALDDSFTDFEGNNCDESAMEDGQSCAGWDGESHRCSCGNRRVYWEINRTDDGKFYALAVAY